MPPVNDDLANATDLGSAASGLVTFDVTNATVETAESYLAGHTVWFSWTAPGDGTVSFDTAATPAPRWDSVLAIYESDGSRLALDDDGLLQPGVTTPDGFGTSKVTADVVGGTTYFIQADSYDYAAAGANPSAGYPRSDCKLRWAWTAVVPPAPTLTSFTPTEGRVGTSVVLTGTHFTGATDVTISGEDAPFTVDSATQITATVPFGARGAGTPIEVTTPGGTASLAGFTPLYPGPWEQPPDDDSHVDEDLTWIDKDGIYTSDIANPVGAGSPDFSAHWTHPIAGSDTWRTSEKIAYQGDVLDTFEWLREIRFGAVDLNLFFMPSPGPTADERAQPHYVTWEAEGPQGVPVGSPQLDFTLAVGTLGYVDDVENKTASPLPDIMQGTVQIRRPPSAAYVVGDGVSDLTPDAWPSAANLTSWPVIETEPVLVDGKTVTVSDNGPNVDAIVEATPNVTYTWTSLYPVADLDDGVRLPLILTLSRWADGVDLTEPTLIEPAPHGLGHSGFKGATVDSTGAFVCTLTVHVTFTFRPPRYRILYDRPLALAQRQFPRDDGLGMSAARSWPTQTSTQSGIRRGPTAIT